MLFYYFEILFAMKTDDDTDYETEVTCNQLFYYFACPLQFSPLPFSPIIHVECRVITLL